MPCSDMVSHSIPEHRTWEDVCCVLFQSSVFVADADDKGCRVILCLRHGKCGRSCRRLFQCMLEFSKNEGLQGIPREDSEHVLGSNSAEKMMGTFLVVF